MKIQTLKFWWNYLINPGFRQYIHFHDKQKFLDDIQAEINKKAEYESRMRYFEQFPNNKKN